MGQILVGLGGILKAVSGLVVFGFLVWSMYFQGSYEFGIFKGIVAFFLLSLFSGFTSMFPFGTTFAPLLFEWWWHDVPFWHFSNAAWAVTAVSMAANVLLLIGILVESRKK